MELIKSDLRAEDHIRNIFRQLNTTLPEDLFSPLVQLHVGGVRAKLHVSMYVDDQDPNYVIKKNHIMEAQFPTISPEINVFAQSNDSHVMRGSQYGASKLPINPKIIT